MKISDMLFGFLFLSAIVLGIGGFYSQTGANYNYTSPAIEAYANDSAISDIVSDMSAPLQSGQLTFADAAFVVLNTGWTALTIPFRMASVFSNFFANLASTSLGIQGFPTWAIDILSAMILAVLVFGVLVAITRSQI